MNLVDTYQEALTLFREKKYEEALERISEARSAVRRWPRADILTAYILREQKRYLTEIDVLQSCLESLSASEAGDRNIAATAWSLLGSAYYMLGRCREAVDAFRQSARWEESVDQKRREASNALFAAHGLPDGSPEEYRQLYREYRSLLEDIPPYPLRLWHHSRLRIGYLSNDFREHPLAYLIWAHLGGHDRTRFRVYCYAGNEWDWVTRKLHGAVEEWHDISDSSDEEIAERIRRDEIDILFDLSGHTMDNHLPVMAYHPATIQISGLGDVNSTGLEQVEYYWADRNCSVEGTRDYFSETLLSGLSSLYCYTPLRAMPEVVAAPCERREGITFGCFNNFSKVTDEILLSWSEILRRIPTSRLVLKHRLFDSAEGIEYTMGRFRRIGMDCARIELRGFSENYLEEYGDIDIALDTYPYVGGITTCEALYSGVPVVTLYGVRMGTRIGYSVLTSLGLEELAAVSYGDYISKAVALAGDREFIALLHRNLRDMMQQSRLMDAKGYVGEVEELYQRLWQKAQELSADSPGTVP